MSQPIGNRYDFIILYDVENGNPNGDPDADNMPRIDPETGIGLVSDVCIKRKIRNYVDTVKSGENGYRIYIKPDSTLNAKDKEALDEFGIDSEGDDKAFKANVKAKKKDDPDLDIKIRDFMCRNFFDVRTFGQVMTTFTKGSLSCGRVCGPVQVCFGKSIDPITPIEISMTRGAITTEKDAEDKNTEFAHKYIVPYALYRTEGFISANLAQRTTGFSEEDLELLWEAIEHMFDDDHSAARGKMVMRELIIFKHDSALGNAPAYQLFDKVHIEHSDTYNGVPRQYSDYTVTVDEDMPAGVTCIRRK